MEEYTKEELWKIYEILPDDLKAVIFAKKTAKNITLACREGELEDKKIPKVARQIGYVLMGLLPPKELKQTLEKKLKVDPKTAKKIADQIARLIFNPVEKSLLAIYQKNNEIPEKNLNQQKKLLSKKINKKNIRLVG